MTTGHTAAYYLDWFAENQPHSTASYDTALHMAMDMRDYGAMREMIDHHGVNVEGILLQHRANVATKDKKWGMPPLCTACAYRHCWRVSEMDPWRGAVEMVRLLLDAKASVNERGGGVEGEGTALHHACGRPDLGPDSFS